MSISKVYYPAASYGSLWWQMVYAAQPSYRFAREGGIEPLPIEAEAERAAVAVMVAGGILDSEIAS